MPPRGGLDRSLGERSTADQSPGIRRISPPGAAPVASCAEDSPSGLWRSLGKRVGLTALRGSNPLSSANAHVTVIVRDWTADTFPFTSTAIHLTVVVWVSFSGARGPPTASGAHAVDANVGVEPSVV